MNVDLFLSRLRKVRQLKPNSWAACCPAHADKAPSLSITLAQDRILFHCFSGCEPDRILSAVGLRWRDLFDGDDWKAAAAQAAATPVRLKPLDLLDHERLILEIAAADLRAGKELNIEDRARVQLACERLGMEAAA